MASVSTYKLDTVLELKAPAPLWRFVAIMPALTNTNPITSTQAAMGMAPTTGPKSTFSNSCSPISVYVEDIEIPQLNISTTSRLYGGRSLNYPGRVAINGFSAIFYETENYIVTDYLTLWRNNVYNDRGNFGLPCDYKKSINIYVFDTKGVNTAMFTLSGVYPESPSGYNFSSVSSDRLKVNCSFSADFSTFHRGSVNSAESKIAQSTLGKNPIQLVQNAYNDLTNMFA